MQELERYRVTINNLNEGNATNYEVATSVRNFLKYRTKVSIHQSFSVNNEHMSYSNTEVLYKQLISTSNIMILYNVLYSNDPFSQFRIILHDRYMHKSRYVDHQTLINEINNDLSELKEVDHEIIFELLRYFEVRNTGMFRLVTSALYAFIKDDMELSKIYLQKSLKATSS